MNKALEIHPDSLSERALELVFAKAKEWQITPEEAMSRLLDELAKNEQQQSAA
jgi:hypothetical protein